MAEEFVIRDGCLKEYNGPGGVVEIPEGVEVISQLLFWGERGDAITDIHIPGSVKAIQKNAFEKCAKLASVTLSEGLNSIETQAFIRCAALKAVTIPASVTQVYDKAFARCRRLERVTILGSGTKLERCTFEGCPRLVLIAPHIVPGDLQNKEERIALALGWMLNRDLYSEEVNEAYAQYAKGRKKVLLEAAEKRPAAVKKAVYAYYGIQPPKRARPDKANPYAGLSEQKKVLLLEKTILSGDMAKLEEVLTGCGAFEFTARALGLACRFGSLEMVRRLVEAGMSFQLPRDSGIKGKYDTYTVYRSFFGTDTVWHCFERMLMVDTLDDARAFGDFRGIRGSILEGKERVPIPEEERITILRWLAHQKKAQLQGSMMIYDALLAGKTAFADALVEERVCLKNFDLSREETEAKLRIAPQMLDIARKQGMKMPVSLALLTNVVESAELVRRLLDEGEAPEKLDTTKLLKSAMNASSAGTLALCLERGFLKSIATREKLIAQAIEENKTEHTAVLLEYKNRTADLAKEAAAQEAKDWKDLTADPNSAYMMKKLWRYAKQKDGTIVLTGYKGPGGEVYVPDRIGKTAVTAIGPDAFSFYTNANLTNEQRNARCEITAVIIPEGVESIGEYAFWGCEKLECVTLPKGLKKLGRNAFRECRALKKIVLPNGLKKLENSVFEDCTSLCSVTLPQRLLSIGDGAFSGCRSLTIIEFPASVRKIEGAAFDGCSDLKKIAIPEGLQKLEAFVFRRCEKLLDLTIPASVTQIASNLFDYNGAATPGLVIRGVPGSAAEAFAKEVKKTFRPL